MRFGVFEVDVRAGELRKNGAKVRLQEQPFQLLCALLERPGEVVTRDELRQRLWPAGVHVDFERGLNKAVVKLREALGDLAESPRFVETVPLRGYRFIAPTLASPEPSGRAPDRPVESPSPTTRAMRALATLAGLAIVGITLRLWPASRSASSSPTIASIAILPLANLSEDAEQDYFVDGMTDALITELSKTGAVRVISRTSVMLYKGKPKLLREIAQELNVEAVLEGSVARSGERVRVNAQLIRASDDGHLWAETYESDLRDVLTLQSDLARRIAQEIRVKIAPGALHRAAGGRPVDPEAYEAYLKGRYHLNRFGTEDLRKAFRHFEHAIQRDPGFAPAHAGIADFHSTLGIFRRVPPQEAGAAAKAALAKALALDGTLGEAHRSLAWVMWRFDWNWPAVEPEFKRALELNPNDASAHSLYALFLGWEGRVAEAGAEAQRARELSPLSLLGENPGVFYQTRQYDRMMEGSRRLLDLFPDSWLAHIWAGFAHQGAGRLREAVGEYEKAWKLSAGDLDAAAALAHAYAVTGEGAKARKVLDELERRARKEYVSPYMIATIYAGLGRKDEAFTMLERACEEKSADLSYFVKADLRLDSLRSDPRFAALLQQMGLS